MIKDIGATYATVYNNHDWEYMDLTLVDGYWEIEMSEEDFYAPGVDWFVEFKGEFGQDNVWQVFYEEGHPQRRIQFTSNRNSKILGVYISPDEDWADLSYVLFDKTIIDMYYDRTLDLHQVQYTYDESYDWFTVCYNLDKTVAYVTLWYDQDSTYYYFIPEYGWYDVSIPDPEYKVPTPAGYEDKDLAYFTNLAPCIIDCAHSNRIPATCETPEICALCTFVEEGSRALGHDWTDPTCENPTVCKRGCKFDEDNSLGHTDRDSDHKCDRECGKEDMGEHADVELDHACDYCDGQMGTHSDGDDANHLCDYGCGEIADDGCPADGNCDECSENTSAAPDTNESEANETDTNAADTDASDDSDVDTPKDGNGLSLGVIIGIVVGAVAVVGIGGFSLFWFVIKKKNWSDLVGIFNK